LNNESIPVVKPTEIERKIWSSLEPQKTAGPRNTGGLVRNKAFVFRDVLDWPEWSGEPSKLNPEHWESKLLAGCRGEWFAQAVEGARRVLDVGCGSGFPSFYLAKYDHEVVGVDPSPSEIATARAIAELMNNPGNVRFEVIEEQKLCFDDSSFDAATLGHSLECAGDPQVLLSEVKRVLRPGSPIAIQEEDRSLEPPTHPVWEKCRWAFFDNEIWIWYETRISGPYLDRRYMLKLDSSGSIAQRLQTLKDQVLSRNEGLPVADLKTSGISLEEALSQSVEATYSEARGYDPVTLSELLTRMGLTRIRFFSEPDGRRFAESLAEQGLLDKMPDDIRGVLRALVKSVPPTERPISTMVSCKTPGDSNV
jgi:ubiquinone/menaquinone biosynthesis C-methylase UbiE